MHTNERIHALDSVRAFALLLGVVHHATLSFIPEARPGMYAAVTDSSSSEMLAIVSFTGHIFRMSLFFLMAGFFARLVIERKGLRAFCKDRLQRVLVPLVLGWIVFFPLISVAWHWGLTRSFSDSLHAIWPLSIRSFPLSYLWFLYYLLVIYVLAIGVRGLMRTVVDRHGELRDRADDFVRGLLQHRWKGLVLLTAPVCAALLTESNWRILGGIITPNGSLIPQPLAVFAYGMAFLLGWMVHRDTSLLALWRDRWRGYLLAALGATILAMLLSAVRMLPLNAAAMQFARLAFAATYTFAGWCWIFGITGFALRFLSVPNAARRYVADASYWIYLVHYPIILALEDVLADRDWHWTLKFPVTLGVTLLLSFFTYHYAVRYTIVGRILNGRRHVRDTRPEVVSDPTGRAITMVSR